MADQILRAQAAGLETMVGFLETMVNHAIGTDLDGQDQVLEHPRGRPPLSNQ